jgi:hypothetical protein
MVLLLSRSLEMDEHETVILYHTDRGLDKQASGSLPFATIKWLILILADVGELQVGQDG